MIIWEREKQCASCYYECGYNDPVGMENEEIRYEHVYDCNLGNRCDTDMFCLEFKEDL